MTIMMERMTIRPESNPLPQRRQEEPYALELRLTDKTHCLKRGGRSHDPGMIKSMDKTLVFKEGMRSHDVIMPQLVEKDRISRI